MIITKKINIKISSRNITFYRKIYENISIGDIIEIDVEKLHKGSPLKIIVGCDICGKEKEMQYRHYLNNINKSKLYYCNKCKHLKIKQTKFEKYGDENYNNIEKYKETCFNKYGVDHPNKTKLKNKIKQTKFEKYGDENYNNIEKTKKTKFEKYNNENYNNIIKYKETCYNKYGVDNPLKDKNIIKKRQKTNKNKLIKKYKKYDLIDINYKKYNYICICKKHGKYEIPKTIFYNRIKTKSTLCTICNPVDVHISDKENKILKFIKENYSEEIIENSRNIIKPYELDIYLPKLNLAFEFNGIYWHNELYRPNNYHKEKSDLCEINGIQLIHIWEDDWAHKQEIVKSMILNKLGKTKEKIYGRKTEVKEISDNKLIRNFLENNHIQGFVGSSIKLGLYYENELVSLMTFGKKRKIMKFKTKNDNEFELLRFCNKLNTNVIGGASKLFKHFIKNYKYEEIITYADRSHSNGNLYYNLEFDFIHKTSPNYYYVIDNKRFHRFNFRKDKLIREGYDKNKTEHEIMLERKIYRIYNAGNLKFIFLNKI